MHRSRRNLLGIALLGATGPLLAAPPRRRVVAARLDAELAAVARDPACELASLSVLAIRAGEVAYTAQFGQRFIGHGDVPDRAITLPPDAPGTRLVEGGGLPAVGHLGDAYGLMSIFVADLERKHGMIVLVGGTSTDPFAPANKGRYSALARFQERILTALYRGAILEHAPNNGA